MSMTQDIATPERRAAARRAADAGMLQMWSEPAGGAAGRKADLLGTLSALCNGDFSVRLPSHWPGMDGRIAVVINEIAATHERLAAAIVGVSVIVGEEGKLGQRMRVDKTTGSWGVEVDAINSMIDSLAQPVREVSRVIGAVARGALGESMQLDLDGRPLQGEFLRNARTINTMLDQLNSFSSEVTRVAREVGTEGKLGGQAQVVGASGVWKDLTDNVNIMADNLTDQVRGMAKVVTGIAVGNLKQKMMVPAKVEVAALADTINDMVDTLATFSDQVTRVAREVGVEGRLGGQAVVPGASGSWRDLVDNVNELAANLSTQVRAIGEVATAVTKGDLQRTIQVAARGEVADLKDNLNQMIRNLRETTARNTEQDWLKTNLARLTRMLQGQRDIVNVARMLLSELAPLVDSPHAVLYLMQAGQDSGGSPATARLKLVASYGFQERKGVRNEWQLGEGAVGQAAFEKKRILITHVPEGYIQVVSGLGAATPANIVVLPILFEYQVKAVIEIAAFAPFQPIHLSFLDQLAEGLGIVFTSIETAAGTETLLRRQAQLLEGEFTSQQNQLQNTNAELERKARQLAEQNAEVERKNSEIEEARRSLQDKAEQLGLTSRYKSEFLANMSHELRTPLNSLLLLAEQLRQNRERNLTDKQLEMVRVMHGSGRDLLRLINDILDLSKIESGNVQLETERVDLHQLAAELDKAFRYLAESKGLRFAIDFAPELPACLVTDGQRVKQLLTNLLSNALKFTSKGFVALGGAAVREGWSPGNAALDEAVQVIRFSVRDSGIGIAADKQRLIFEAFQQADAGTARRYGGTGLGLAICREIARLLKGELQVHSHAGSGSSFEFYLPHNPGAAHGTRVEAPAAQAPAPARPGAPPATPLLLVIEDDEVFAATLQGMARERGFDALIAPKGEQGIKMAQRYRPDAITLDLNLPDMDGWDIADRLRADPETRDIPLHVISVRDRPNGQAPHGVSSYTTKPADLATLAQVFAELTADAAPPHRVLLLIADEPGRRAAIMALLSGPERAFDAVAGIADAFARLHSHPYQGVVIDVDLPDSRPLDLLQRIRTDPALAALPAVLFSEHPLDAAMIEQARQFDAEVIIDGGGEAALRQAEAVAEFLLRVKGALAGSQPDPRADLAGAEQRAAAAPGPEVAALEGRWVLVVDDDARNLYALTGLLESYGMRVSAAESGQEALRILDSEDAIEIVLMDIMMPDMDGFDTIRRLRADPRLARLPVIALTAKAMLDDRDKCIEAGASDYAPKPVDTGQLLTQLSHWLDQGRAAA